MTHTFTSSNIVKDMQKSLDCILLDIEKYEDIYKENIKLKKELENKTNQYNIINKIRSLNICKKINFKCMDIIDIIKQCN